MTTGDIVLYLSMIVWALPPFRQRGTRFFTFFLLIALEDPAAFILTDFFGYTSIDTYIFFDLARFLSLFRKDEIISQRFIFGIAFGFILLMHFLSKGTPTNILLNSLIHFSIFLKLLQIFVQEVSFEKITDIFLIMLIFYQINTVTKVVNTMTMFSDSYNYFLLSSAFQLLLGMFFFIFRYKDKRLLLRLR